MDHIMDAVSKIFKMYFTAWADELLSKKQKMSTTLNYDDGSCKIYLNEIERLGVIKFCCFLAEEEYEKYISKPDKNTAVPK